MKQEPKISQTLREIKERVDLLEGLLKDQDLKNYIILEGKSYGTYSYPDLLVSMEKTHFDNNWHQAHEELNKENEFMLTIRQYIDFINLLKSGNAFDGRGNKVHNNKLDSILDEILTVRDPWRAEHLDARFDVNFINYNHRVINGKLEAQTSEPLEDCLMTDKTSGISLDYWLKSATKQGLPPVNTPDGDLWYWHPRNDTVAGFYAGSSRVYLFCNKNPLGSDASLGVRPARKK